MKITRGVVHKQTLAEFGLGTPSRAIFNRAVALTWGDKPVTEKPDHYHDVEAGLTADYTDRFAQSAAHNYARYFLNQATVRCIASFEAASL